VSKQKTATTEADSAQTPEVEPVETQDQTMAVTTVEGALPVALNDMYAEDAGAGLDDMSASDLAMPFLAIIQKSSPQVDELNTQKYMPNAKAGMILNTLTGDLYDGKTGVPVLACGYQKLFTEWTPRDQGGGFQGHHHEDSPVIKNSKVDDKNKRHTPNGNLLVDTAYYFTLAVPDSGMFQAMVSMSSTQLKKSRKWNSLMKGIVLKTKAGKSFTPPMYSHIYLLQTEPESNDQGSWYGWKITTVKMLDDMDLLQLAKKFNDQIKSGAVRTGPPPSEEAQATSDVPF
jgi:hypothetical protein